MAKETKVFDSDIRYSTEYRKINYPRLEFRKGELELILPIDYKDEKKLLEKHKLWIRSKQKFIESAILKATKKKLEKRSEIQLKSLIRNIIIKEKIATKNIYFKNMKSKWASCSSNKNLTFNSQLKYLPNYLIKYIVFHELTHFKEKKHNLSFWKLISEKFRNYEKYEEDLMIYWFLIKKKL